MLDRGLNHLKTPLTIYTTRDKIRLYFVDFCFRFTSLISLCTKSHLQWKHRGLCKVFEFALSLGDFLSLGENLTIEFTILDGR